MLTFTTEIGTAILKALDITSGYNPQVELISVDGPEGALFSFWERYSIAPKWSRMTGWRQTTTDRPSFSVALNDAIVISEGADLRVAVVRHIFVTQGSYITTLWILKY